MRSCGVGRSGPVPSSGGSLGCGPRRDGERGAKGKMPIRISCESYFAVCISRASSPRTHNLVGNRVKAHISSLAPRAVVGK